MKIALSACLAGDKVRYDGTDKLNEEIMKLLEGHEVVRICPEFSAGFAIPHPPIERKDGKIVDEKLNDYTAMLKEGCLKEYERIRDCDLLILKSRSPSCGSGLIYDGTFKGMLVEGNGMFADLCLEKGLIVFNDEQYEEIASFLKK